MCSFGSIHLSSGSLDTTVAPALKLWWLAAPMCHPIVFASNANEERRSTREMISVAFSASPVNR